eukprot:Sspe_Gene.34865::Locus_16932_Transcript_1_1_Confidence_1.000_Length_1640::g.34865::m.34865
MGDGAEHGFPKPSSEPPEVLSDKELAATLKRPYDKNIRQLGHWSMRRKAVLCRKLLNDLRAARTLPGKHTYTTVLWLMASAGQPRVATEVFKDMEVRGLTRNIGDSSPFDALLKAHAVSAKVDLSAIREVWVSMTRVGVKPRRRSLEILAL